MATEPGIGPSGGPGLSERAARGCHVRAEPPSSPRPEPLEAPRNGSGCLTLGTSGILRSESVLTRGTASWIGIIRCLAGVTPILPFREGPRLWPLDPVLDQPKLLSKAGLVQEVSATSCGGPHSPAPRALMCVGLARVGVATCTVVRRGNPAGE